MKKNKQKLETIEITIQEIWETSKRKVHRNKKKYTRKSKHKNKE